MSTEPLIVTKRDDGVAIVSTNDDPLNRMSVAYIDLLEEVIDDIAADDSVRAFVLTGCTFRLAASEGASIGLPEMDLGTTPAWGGSARLAKCVGRNHALDMILRTKKITGPEALEIGLVTEVWPLAELKDRAVALAGELAAQPRLAVKAMLDALHDSEDKTLDELLAGERAGVHATRGTPDAREGMLAFLEKRRPVFNQPQ